MKHPPIPPKCEFFYNPRNPLFRISLAGAGFSIGVGEAIGTEREIIAAVAEVEWRKRAARWRDLIDALYSDAGSLVARHRQPGTCGRFGLFRAASNNCYDHAEQWREWGKQ